MGNTTIIPAGKIDVEGLKKVGIGALIAAAGALLTYIENGIPGLDFGEWTPIVVMVNSVVVNFLRKLIFPYEKK